MEDLAYFGFPGGRTRKETSRTDPCTPGNPSAAMADSLSFHPHPEVVKRAGTSAPVARDGGQQPRAPPRMSSQSQMGVVGHLKHSR